MNKIRIALAGNPNCGKTTLYNALTGARQKVGNYPGVTVEKKEGTCSHRGHQISITDLPGLYSLSSYSLDEVVARDFLLHEKPDIVVNVIDSTNLERNLYLSLQFQELGIPTILVLNMIDQAKAMGIEINADHLSKLLGVPVVQTIGTKGSGIGTLLDLILDHDFKDQPPREPSYGSEVDQARRELTVAIQSDHEFSQKIPAVFLSSKLLEKDPDALKLLAKHPEHIAIEQLANKHIKHLEVLFGRKSEILISEQRYAYIAGAAKETCTRNATKPGPGDFLDRILMDRFLGLPLFLVIMWGIFQITFTLGEYPTTWLETFFSWLSDVASAALPDSSLLHSLVVDGIIGGVGGVFSFVPLVIILFLLISILEDLGYMSRAAFIMDKYLHAFGLHGQSFLPMMVGFGCSVPAIMAARTLKSPKDRILTILIVPFMSCGAKLPVYVVLSAAFFPENAGNMVLLMYLIGVAVSLLAASILRKTVLKGTNTPFVMELPPYRMPTVKGILWQVWDKTFSYFKKAGTIILAASILIWAATTFPLSPDTSDEAHAMEQSFAGQFGKIIEPGLRPLGFDWKIGIALITGFAAKEVVVSTLGVLYHVASDESNSQSLTEVLRADSSLNPKTALGLMIFVLLVSPCLAALGTMSAELGWKWTVFSVGMTIAVAWLGAFLVNMGGNYLGNLV